MNFYYFGESFPEKSKNIAAPKEVITEILSKYFMEKKLEHEKEGDFEMGHLEGIPKITKEEPTPKVSYNGFTGELVKLERKESYAGNTFRYDGTTCKSICYDLSIYDREKDVTHYFIGVKFSDIRFLGGVVSFGG